MKPVTLNGIVAAIIAIFFTVNLSAQSTLNTDTLKVSGNCESCKKRIEGAALKTKGVKTAVWDVKTDILTVSYDAAKTSLTAVGENIAKAGYDNGIAKSADNAYNKLPACCKYERASK